MVSFLYKLARVANDIEKLSSGNPKRIAKRAKNKVIGRTLIKKLMKYGGNKMREILDEKKIGEKLTIGVH